MKFFNNPFTKNSEEKQIEREENFQRESQLLGDGMHPADYQMYMEKQERMAELRRWQQDLSPKWVKAFEDLSGCYQDDTGAFIILDKSISPMCNLTGAKRLIDFGKHLDVNVMMGNWSTANVNNTMLSIGQVMISHLQMNYKTYGIDKRNLSYVLYYLINTIEPSYRRGWNNGERNLDGKIQKTVEAITPNNAKIKKSIFGSN